MRWYFLPFSSFSNLRSPERTSTPFSTVTLISSFLISGSSALMTYSLSSWGVSPSGAHSAPVIVSSSPSRLCGRRPRKLERRFCMSSSSRKGSIRVNAFIGSSFWRWLSLAYRSGTAAFSPCSVASSPQRPQNDNNLLHAKWSNLCNHRITSYLSHIFPISARHYVTDTTEHAEATQRHDVTPVECRWRR